MDIAPEFKKFAQESLQSQLPGPKTAPPLRQGSEPARLSLVQNRATVKQTVPRPAISPAPIAAPGEKTCLKCGDHAREEFMFYCNNEFVCPSCYNPYLHKVSSKSFYAQLGSAFTFPFKGNNIVMLVMGSVFFGILTLFSRISAMATGAIGLAGGGFLAEYLLSIISSSAYGSDDLPDWPDFGVGHVCIASLQMLLAVVVPMLPAAAFYFLLVRTGCGGFFTDIALILADPTISGVIFIVLLIVWGFYIPAATSSISLSSSIIGTLVQISPHKIIPMIARAPGEYLVISVIMLFTGLIHSTAQVICVLFSGMWIGSVISVPFSLYLLFVEMRLLGLFMRLSGKRANNEERWKLLEAGKLPHRRKPIPLLQTGATTKSGE